MVSYTLFPILAGYQYNLHYTHWYLLDVNDRFGRITSVVEVFLSRNAAILM